MDPEFEADTTMTMILATFTCIKTLKEKKKKEKKKKTNEI